MKYANMWTDFANITFVVTPTIEPNAHIRVSFRERGSWSALGKDALN
jgi:hypothetical protein